MTKKLFLISLLSSCPWLAAHVYSWYTNDYSVLQSMTYKGYCVVLVIMNLYFGFLMMTRNEE